MCVADGIVSPVKFLSMYIDLIEKTSYGFLKNWEQLDDRL